MRRLASALRVAAKPIASRVIPPRHRLRLAVLFNLRHGEAELQLLPQLLDPTRAFLDVGGNIGLYAAVAERHTEHVYVFEPHPLLVERLRRSLRPTTRVMQLALSDHTGDAVLWAPDVLSRCSLERSASGELPVIPINVSTARLDDIEIPAVGLIKIDVEGHELAVLRGAQEALTRDRPAIVVEIEKRHQSGNPADTLEYLEDLGYQGFFVHRGKLRRLEDYDFSNFQRAENVRLPGTARHPDYINNFIFVHTSDIVSLDRLSRIP